MNIAWQAFTPWAAVTGGALIGLAATALLLVTGRIAGISGILAGLLRAPGDRAWRFVFVVGLLLAPLVVHLFVPGLGVPAPAEAPDARVLLLAGLLVGVGTRLANGCTSGHGVCGLARLSLRSLAAVAVFMGTAMGVVFVVRHVFAGGGA